MNKTEQQLVEDLVLAVARIPWPHIKPRLTRAGLLHLQRMHEAIGALVKAAEAPPTRTRKADGRDTAAAA